jgi:hypothetical protein
MEAESEEKQEIIELVEKTPLPRPVSPRDCECGCGNRFQPNRRDQMYLNKQHADYGYNHVKRKEKNLNRKKCEKILLLNDNILKKHCTSDRSGKQVDCYYDIIKAEGFKFAYNVGRKEVQEVVYNYTYNYTYSIYLMNKIKMIKILKR